MLAFRIVMYYIVYMNKKQIKQRMDLYDKIPMSIRIPRNLRVSLIERSTKENRSLSNLIIMMLAEKLEDDNK